MKGWLTALFVGLLGALGVYRERSRRLERDVEDATANGEALARQSEALRQQAIEAQEERDAAHDHDYTASDFNDLLRKR